MSLWRTARLVFTGFSVVRVTVPHGVRLVRAVARYRKRPAQDTRAALVHEGATLIHAAVRAARHLQPKKS
jgi:hypothetical protein